jgi:hypothetical protein
VNIFVEFEAIRYGDTATVFTVQVTDDVLLPISEFADFLERAEMDPTVAEDLAEINAQIERLADGGVSPNFLRGEKQAAALPGKEWEIVTREFRPVKDGPLRLYCVLLPHEVIILCNGDRKTTDTAQKCKNVRGHFEFANRLHRKVHERLSEEPERPSLERIEEILEKERLQL